MLQGKDNSDEPPIMMEKLEQPGLQRGMVIPPESMFLDSKCDGDDGSLCSTPSIKTEAEELPNRQKNENPVEHQPCLPLRRGGKVMPHDRMNRGSPYTAPTFDAEAELPHPKKEQPQLRPGGKNLPRQWLLMKSSNYAVSSSSDDDDDDDDDDNDDDVDDDTDDGDGKDDADDGGDDDEDDDFDEIPSSSDPDSSNDSEEGDKPRGGKRMKMYLFKRKTVPAEPLLNQADSSAPACVPFKIPNIIDGDIVSIIRIPMDTPTSVAQMAKETKRVLQEEHVQLTQNAAEEPKDQ